MSKPANTFQTLGGVPVHYDRRHPGDYGTRGAPATFHATSEFEAKLDRCFEQLWELSPFGKAEAITSAGAWVNKPGFHGLGRALDLDGIFWREKTFVALFDGFRGGTGGFTSPSRPFSGCTSDRYSTTTSTRHTATTFTSTTWRRDSGPARRRRSSSCRTPSALCSAITSATGRERG